MIDVSRVPFYANIDNTHCFQAAIRIVLGYFEPERDYSWEELEQLTDKEEGLSTWPQQMLISLDSMNFETKMVEGFDAKAFISKGADYLKEAFGKETAKWQIENSDIPKEQNLYSRAMEREINIECRVPSFEEIETLLKDDWLIICTVNSCKLNDKEGYVGHAVVIVAADDTTVKLHNPGPPAQHSQQVSKTNFVNAWADPNETAQNYIAIKPKGNL